MAHGDTTDSNNPGSPYYPPTLTSGLALTSLSGWLVARVELMLQVGSVNRHNRGAQHRGIYRPAPLYLSTTLAAYAIIARLAVTFYKEPIQCVASHRLLSLSQMRHLMAGIQLSHQYPSNQSSNILSIVLVQFSEFDLKAVSFISQVYQYRSIYLGITVNAHLQNSL